MSKTKYTVKKKLEVINYVMEGHSCNLASHIFDIGISSIRKWVNAYKAHGIDGIKIKKFKPNQYDGDFRVHVVEYMHEHLLSGSEAAPPLSISHPPQPSLNRNQSTSENDRQACILNQRNGLKT